MPLPLVAPARVQTEYGVVIWRANEKGRVELYPISIRNRLPIIPNPLRETDLPASLYLQNMIDQAYLNGRYDHLDYATPCESPLVDKDSAWARDMVGSVEKR